MWTSGKNFAGRGCVTLPPPRQEPRRSPLSERKTTRRMGDFFHVIHKVPAGDSPYVKAKRVQLIDKDFGRAVGLFWAAINAGDRVDSALKDMVILMKQLNRSDEAIEAIKSFRHLCPADSQESLDNVLIELYKRSGRIEEEIQMLAEKLRNVDERKRHSGNRYKTARSQGKKIQVTVDEERSRIMGNLAWAYIQMNNFETAEKLYREALCLKPDKNKQCNLAICLMHLNKVSEAKALLHAVESSSSSSSSLHGETDEAHMKSFERALEMLNELEGARIEARNHFTLPVARDASVSRIISDQFGGEEETWVLNEEKRRVSSFKTPERRTSVVHEAAPRRVVNSAPQVPVRRNISFSSVSWTGLEEGSSDVSRNGSLLQPNLSVPLPDEHNRYSILGSPEQSKPHGFPCATVISRCTLENDSWRDYKMNPEGKWMQICGTGEENSADTVKSEDEGTKTKEDFLAHWFVGFQSKKCWADISEEEEEEEDYFNDEWENVDANILPCDPQSQVNNDLAQRVALFSLEESKSTSVRRSLRFNQNESFTDEGRDGSPLAYHCNSSVEAGIQEQKRQRPRKRLPVFRDITRLHHTA
ncbi:hypothetical protein MLD38_037264 [Melastoma candidum]|uniref:Uncharacterized protein n=1 Tax=Melastoma candidum TaxID=119954 RepID=A0ACB9LMI8_9MYRT|nr:hypothetical protein MLD38_037264 [Melastoma candidum]